MVGGRQVLLSIAVLSGLGFDSVLGAARFRRQDGTGTTVQDAPGVASTSTATLEDVVSSSEPATIALVATSLGDSTGSAPSGGGGPQGFSSSGLGVTVQAEAVLATSTGAEFVDPGAFGAGGTLTSDTRAPSRSADPTKITVDPVSETTKGPPPAETKTSSVRVPPTRPGRPAAPDAGQTTSYNLAQPASTTTAVQVEATTSAQATTTAPRGGPPGVGPPKPTSVQIIQDTTESVNLGYGVTSSAELSAGQTTFATSTRSGNETFTYIPSGGVSYCKPSDLTAAVTSWSITHTSTITWFGNPEDYTPPYPPIVIPQPTQSCVIPVSPPRLTISICASTGTGTKYMTCEVTTTTESFNFGVQTTTVPAIVFLTTDKNPAVVYSTIKTPNYGVSQEPKTRDNHASPTSDGVISTPVYNSQDGPQAVSETAQQQRPTPTPVTVAVQPTAVVINGNTIRDNPAQQTQVVIIADQTFTIDPTRVVGGGATIDRPAATGGVFVPTPTSTVLGGVPVVVSSSIAVIGGSSFTLGPTTTIATVSGHTFTIGPSTIAGASQTLPLPTLPSPTEVVVAGGDLITAIGRSVVVIHGTTLTYATATDGSNSPTTITVDDDVLTLGPGGVTFTAQGGTAAVTIGGTASPQQGTQYALVGGATITKIGASVVVVKSVTYTVGPGTGTTTTAVGGEMVTIRPDGVQVGTLSLGFPFGPTTVITPGAGVGGAGAKATSTASGGGGNGSGGDGEEDAAGAVRPWLVGVGWGLAIALMVGRVV